VAVSRLDDRLQAALASGQLDSVDLVRHVDLACTAIAFTACQLDEYGMSASNAADLCRSLALLIHSGRLALDTAWVTAEAAAASVGAAAAETLLTQAGAELKVQLSAMRSLLDLAALPGHGAAWAQCAAAAQAQQAMVCWLDAATRLLMLQLEHPHSSFQGAACLPVKEQPLDVLGGCRSPAAGQRQGCSRPTSALVPAPYTCSDPAEKRLPCLLHYADICVYACERRGLGVMGSLSPASGRNILEVLQQHGLPLAADHLRACCSRGAGARENSGRAQGSTAPGPPEEQQEDEEVEARCFTVAVLSGILSPCLQGALTAHLGQHGCQGLLRWAHRLAEDGLLLPPERPAAPSSAAAGAVQQQRLQQRLQLGQHTFWIAHSLVSPVDVWVVAVRRWLL
jgi:hypothetical protein